jgi:hypothetical protein
MASVGAPFNVNISRWPEGAHYVFRREQHELLIFLAGASAEEIAALARGQPHELALVAEPPILLFLYRFGDPGEGIPWGVAPYSWHLLPTSERVLPPGGVASSLRVSLIDATTGLLCAVRDLPLSPDFTRALHEAIRAQSAAPWPGKSVYDMVLDRVSLRRPRQLAAQARVCLRGSA